MMENKEKGYAAIKLGIWVVLIAVLVIIVKTDDKKVDKDPKRDIIEVEKINYIDKLNNIDVNYSYKYTITTKENNIVYEGRKLGEKESGIKFIDDKRIDYYLDRGYTYEVTFGALNRVESIYNEIDENLISLSYIKDLIKDQDYVENDNRYEYNIDGNNILISVNEKDIYKIEIINDNSSYLLEYNNINEIKEVNY